MGGFIKFVQLNGLKKPPRGTQHALDLTSNTQQSTAVFPWNKPKARLIGLHLIQKFNSLIMNLGPITSNAFASL